MVAITLVEIMSSHIPPAILEIILAVAGAITIISAVFEISKWSIFES